MKKLVSVLSILFLAAIVFFTLMGERLFYSTKPTVEIDRPIRIGDRVFLPKTAVFKEEDGEYIYTVTVRQGFSAELLSVTRVRLLSSMEDDTGYLGEDYMIVEAEGYTNSPTVISSSRPLKDGDMVVEG